MNCSPAHTIKGNQEAIKIEDKYLADQYFQLYKKNDQTLLSNQRFILNSTNNTQIDKDILLKYYFQKLSSTYQIEGILSSSATGLVLQAIQKNTQITYAIKIIPNSQLFYQHSRVKTQLKILKSLQSDRCINIRESFIDERSICIVMDYMKYGTLHNYLLRQERRLQENIIKQIMLQLFQGVMYVHSMGIIHRDLKPQNILIRDEQSLDLVIGDFGQADYCTKHGLKTRCGDVGFMAPEMMNGGFYDFKVDVYSLGAICFMLFYGTEIRQVWDRDSFSQDAPLITEEAEDFINKCTETNPCKRITVKEALKHPWFNANIVDFNLLENQKNDYPSNSAAYENEDFWLFKEEDTDSQVIPNFANMIHKEMRK